MLLDQIGRCGNPNLTKTHDGRRPVAFGDVGLRFRSSKSSDQKIPRTPPGGTRAVFGEQSSHYRNLQKEYLAFRGYSYEVGPARGVFLAAKSDYEGGYLFSIQSEIFGEIFGDFVTAAKTALGEGQKDVAAVLSCAALEDALKRFAQMHSLTVTDKDMTEVINALKGAGLLSGPQKSLVDVMPRIRNAAMHADWNKITAQDVGSVIGFVEQFLLTKF